MRSIKLVVVNSIVWLIAHLIIASSSAKMSNDFFERNDYLFKVKRWKAYLPDGSTDDTALIAQDFGATVISFHNQSKWKGKTAACYRGAEVATGEVLMFLDADTYFYEPSALLRIAASFKGGLMSIQPYHEMKRCYEQGSLYFNLLTVFGMNATSAFKSVEGVFGPCVVCTRKDYLKTGGHKAASHTLIEGFGLGTLFKEHGFVLHNYIGKDTIHFRMYPESAQSMTQGWMKHFAAGSAQTDKRVLLLIICWISGAFIPLLILIYPEKWFILLCVYLMYSLLLYRMSKIIGNFNLVTVLCYPIALGYFIYVFIKSIIAIYIKKEVNWKNRKIDL